MSLSSTSFLTESLDPTEKGVEFTAAEARFCWLDQGVLNIEPNQPSELPAAILTVGVHGNETVPVRLVDHWLSELCAGSTPISRPLLIILGNPEAVKMGERFVEHNLNRLFSVASADASAPECRRAVTLMGWVQQFIERHPEGLHFDMHSTIKGSDQDRFAIIPDACQGRNLNNLLSWFKHFRVDAWVQNISPAATFSSFTANLGYQSATLELGQVSTLNDPIDRFLPLVDELNRLAFGPGGVCEHEPTGFQVVREILKSEGTFVICIENFVNFRRLPMGTLIARGEFEEWRIEQEGDALLFLNPAVPVGHRVALVIRALA